MKQLKPGIKIKLSTKIIPNFSYSRRTRSLLGKTCTLKAFGFGGIFWIKEIDDVFWESQIEKIINIQSKLK